jgi:hypothetical protein
MEASRNPNQSSRGIGAWLAGALGIGWLALAPSATATPARFVYEACDSALPGGNALGAHYVQNQGEAFAASNSCAKPGGSIAITQTGHLQATFAFWTVPVPVTPGGEIESMSVTGAACNTGPGSRWFVVANGWPPSACSESQHLIQGLRLGLGVWVFLGCDGNYAPGCDTPATVSARYFAAIEKDPQAPTVSELRGSLIGGGVLHGRQVLTADLGDVGGGLSEAEILVNGVAVGEPLAENCNLVAVNNTSVRGLVATSASPCPEADAIERTIDTQVYPFHDGENSVQICASDLSTLNEPNRGCSKRQIVMVDNSCEPSAVDGGEVLSAGFSGTSTESVEVGPGHGAEVRGRLSTRDGVPVRGATICVRAETLGLHGGAADIGTVRTDATGEYHYGVAPGPNRRIVVGYRHDARQISRDLRFFSRVRPSLKLSPPKLRNGEGVHLWGRLPRPEPGDRVVVIQANPPSSKRWITFRRTTTDTDGQYRARYRFTSTTRRTRYRFRALVPRQAGYPWLEGTSRPQSVLVKRGS